MSGTPRVSIAVPVYNGERYLGESLDGLLGQTFSDFELVIADNASTDGTEAICADLAMRDEWVTVINFSRNFGKESALFAGLEYAEGDAMVPIDVDLQDPIELVAQMVERWQQGADVVLAKRRDRAADTPFKRWSARLYYRLHNRIASTHIEENVGDFRLLDRKVVAAILDFLTVFFAGGYAIGKYTGNLTDDGFKLEGAPALVLFAVIILYFVVFSKYLGGTLWQRVLGAR